MSDRTRNIITVVCTAVSLAIITASTVVGQRKIEKRCSDTLNDELND